MKYIKRVWQGAIVACFFILLFHMSRFLSAEKNIDTVVEFIGQSLYNLGMVFVTGPIASISMEKALRNDDETTLGG